MKVKIEVLSNEWAGTLNDSWRPAIDGTLNQTSEDAEEASIFATKADAIKFLPMIREQHPDAIRLVAVGSNQVIYEEEQSETDRDEYVEVE